MASAFVIDTVPKKSSFAGILDCILKEFNVYVIEKKNSVAKILPSFPILFIIYASCTLGTFFMLLPHEQVDGSPVPIVVFKDRPIAFHGFLVSIMLSFTCSFSALMIQHRPRVEIFFRVYAMASMISALVILLCAATRWGFRYRPHLVEQKLEYE